MSTLFYVTVFHALGVYSTPWSHRVEEGPHPIEVLQVNFIYTLLEIVSGIEKVTIPSEIKHV